MNSSMKWANGIFDGGNYTINGALCRESDEVASGWRVVVLSACVYVLTVDRENENCRFEIMCSFVFVTFEIMKNDENRIRNNDKTEQPKLKSYVIERFSL